MRVIEALGGAINLDGLPLATNEGTSNETSGFLPSL